MAKIKQKVALETRVYRYRWDFRKYGHREGETGRVRDVRRVGWIRKEKKNS